MVNCRALARRYDSFSILRPAPAELRVLNLVANQEIE